MKEKELELKNKKEEIIEKLKTSDEPIENEKYENAYSYVNQNQIQAQVLGYVVNEEPQRNGENKNQFIVKNESWSWE